MIKFEVTKSMSIKFVKAVTISSSKKLELSINEEEKVIKIEGFRGGERKWTHFLSYPISEDEAVERFKDNFES